MKNKKGVFTINRLLIGILLFVLFVVFLGSAYVSMTSEYGIQVSDKYSKYNTRLEAITNKTTSIGEAYQGGSVSPATNAVLAVETIYSGIQIMLSTLSIPLGIVADFYSDIPFVPKIFITVLITIITIGFIYAAGTALARWWM